MKNTSSRKVLDMVCERLEIGDRKALIIHHDDLGYNASMNDAYRALPFSTGSLLVTSPHAVDLIEHSEEGADLGVHLTLNSEFPLLRMKPLSDAKTVRDAAGWLWQSKQDAWSIVTTGDAELEFRAQIDEALRRGIDVTHIDSHMTSAFRPDIATVYLKLLEEYRLPGFVPAQFFEAGPGFTYGSTFKSFPQLENSFARAKAIRIMPLDTYNIAPSTKRQWLLETLRGLDVGIYQLMHHAALASQCAESFLDKDVRVSDMEALSDPAIIEAIGEFAIITYRDLRDAMRECAAERN